MALPIRESFCIGCGRTYAIESFYKSPNPLHHNGVLPYCKDCCNAISRKHLKDYANLESAIWMSCAELSVPFIKKVFCGLEESLSDKGKIGRKYNYIGNYMKIFSQNRKAKDHWESFADTDVSFGDIENVKKHEDSIRQEMDKFNLEWGYQEIEDYQFLEYRFECYTEGLGELSPSQETLYRRLCLVELAIRKKDEEGADTKDEQKQLIQLMKTLKIDDFKNTKDLSVAEKILEAQIAWMEEEEPAFHYKDPERYKDFFGIGAYWNDHILRPLKNLLVGSKEYTLKDTYDEIAEYDESGDKP